MRNTPMLLVVSSCCPGKSCAMPRCPDSRKSRPKINAVAPKRKPRNELAIILFFINRFELVEIIFLYTKKIYAGRHLRFSEIANLTRPPASHLPTGKGVKKDERAMPAQCSRVQRNARSFAGRAQKQTAYFRSLNIFFAASAAGPDNFKASACCRFALLSVRFLSWNCAVPK